MSKREAARRAGISEGLWRQLETGARPLAPGMTALVSPRDETLIAAADAVGLDPNELFRLAGRELPEPSEGRVVPMDLPVEAAVDEARHQGGDPGGPGRAAGADRGAGSETGGGDAVTKCKWCDAELKGRKTVHSADCWSTTPEGKRKATQQGLLILAAIIGVGLLVGAISSRTNTSQTRDEAGHSSSSEDVSPEYALASLDSGPDPDGGEVRHFAYLLDQLEPACTNARMDLADIAVAARQSVREHGRDVTLAGVLQAIERSVPVSARPTDCKEVAIAWVTIFVGGG